jgi:catechol 2,3-dioxygenase-like lactoylglutathione lyase family enzyme
MTHISGSLKYIAPVLRVSDLARSLAFYRDKLGFELDFSYEGFYASVRRDGCYIHLNCAPPTPRDQAAFERAEHIDACLVVQGVEALAAGFAVAGVSFTVPLRRMPYGSEFYVRDPDGYVLGFVQPTP